MILGRIVVKYTQKSRYSKMRLTSEVEESLFLSDDFESINQIVEYITWTSKQDKFDLRIYDNFTYDRSMVWLEKKSEWDNGLQKNINWYVYRDWKRERAKSDPGRTVTIKEFITYLYTILDDLKAKEAESA